MSCPGDRRAEPRAQVGFLTWPNQVSQPLSVLPGCPCPQQASYKERLW